MHIFKLEQHTFALSPLTCVEGEAAGSAHIDHRVSMGYEY